MTNPQDDISVNVFDPDEQETSEWLEALHSVIESEGRDRAHYLMERLADVARQKGVNLPFSSNTAYINTIPPDLQQGSPGNMDYEARLRGWMRWNAMAMVVRANKDGDNLGGHIASFTSLATMFGTGFHHFWRAPTETLRRRSRLFSGTLLSRHLCTCFSGRAVVRGTAGKFPA